MSTTFAIPVRPSDDPDERPIIKQIPSDIKEKLGEWYQSGFDLRDGTREVFFENGYMRYQLGSDVVNVILE